MATKPATVATTIAILCMGALMLYGPQIMHRLDLGTPKATNQLTGDWVGPFTLTGTYKPELYGKTPGPHTSGVLYLQSYRMSPKLDWVEAKGEICVTGEPTTRPIELHVTQYLQDGSFSADFYVTPTLGAFPWKGSVTADTLTLSNEMELGIHAQLHHSTRAAFRQQSTCAPPPDPSAIDDKDAKE